MQITDNGYQLYFYESSTAVHNVICIQQEAGK